MHVAVAVSIPSFISIHTYNMHTYIGSTQHCLIVMAVMSARAAEYYITAVNVCSLLGLQKVHRFMLISF